MFLIKLVQMLKDTFCCVPVFRGSAMFIGKTQQYFLSCLLRKVKTALDVSELFVAKRLIVKSGEIAVSLLYRDTVCLIPEGVQ